MAFCPNCGVENSEGMDFCSNCGIPIAKNSAGQAPPPMHQHQQPYYPPPAPPVKDNTAMIVVVIIVVVIILFAVPAVLYVMVIGFGDAGNYYIETPLGLHQQGRTATSVNLLVSFAPNGAMVEGTSISLTHYGTPATITGAEVYWANATLAATYSYGSWIYQNGASTDSLTFGAGMIIMIEASEISDGDVITISSNEMYFGTTTITI